MISLSIIERAAEPIFSAVCGFGLAMSLLSAFGNDAVASVTRGVKNLFAWIVGIATALITGTLALQTVILVAADTLDHGVFVV